MLALREWTLASGAAQKDGQKGDLASSSKLTAAPPAPHNAVTTQYLAQAPAHGDKPVVGRRHFKVALQRVLPSVSREVGCARARIACILYMCSLCCDFKIQQLALFLGYVLTISTSIPGCGEVQDAAEESTRGEVPHS